MTTFSVLVTIKLLPFLLKNIITNVMMTKYVFFSLLLRKMKIKIIEALYWIVLQLFLPLVLLQAKI